MLYLHFLVKIWKCARTFCATCRSFLFVFSFAQWQVGTLTHGQNLDWKLSADWLMLKKRRKCVNVLQFCVVKTASTNQLRCKSRFNQSAIRKHPSGWLAWWKSHSRCLPVTKLVQRYALSDRALFFACFSIIPLLLKKLTNEQLRKVWDDVTTPHVLSMTGGRRFLLFMFLSRNAAFVVYAMLKYRSFQSRFLSMH